MSPPPSDPRFTRSRASLIAAVIDLVGERPVEAVSITEVAKEAGVTRPTFYQHFPDVPSAARAAALYQLSGAYPYLDADLEGISPDELRKTLEDRTTSVLRHLRQNRAFYLNVFEGAGNIDLFDGLVAIVADRMMLPGASARPAASVAERDRKLLLAGGIMWLSVKWLRTETGASPPRAMARRIVEISLKTGDS